MKEVPLREVSDQLQGGEDNHNILTMFSDLEWSGEKVVRQCLHHSISLNEYNPFSILLLSPCGNSKSIHGGFGKITQT